MKHKYKKFLKAAYINYEEDYCGHRSGTFTKPTVTTPIIVITGTTATIACAVSGATIYYTLDGSTPTSNSTEYTGTITLTLSCTIKAIAVKPGMSDSEVASESYVHYLTQWKIVGNSKVYTDPYLTSWKVSGNSQIQQYLTQWKVSGNSVVDNNTILSCGDLGQDGKYHVKISNGVDVFDIALTEPLRKVNNIADTIEFPSNEGKALVTRYFASYQIKDFEYSQRTDTTNCHRIRTLDVLNTINYDSTVLSNILTANFINKTLNDANNASEGYYVASYNQYLMFYVPKSVSKSDFETMYGEDEILVELATPTTELVDAPQISVSPTNTYSSANTTPYSAFTYATPLIYSCGDYSDVDGKYHVKISNGVTIYDIPLTEPLRKVNDVADTIEFANGVATLTRNLAKSTDLGTKNWETGAVQGGNDYYMNIRTKVLNPTIKIADSSTATVLCSLYNTITAYEAHTGTKEGIGISGSIIRIYDKNYNQQSSVTAFKQHIKDIELIYWIEPVTEVIEVSSIAVSPTDTYTSANVVPFSAFEHTENKEIWSCGEYNATDGKYHILVQPLGGSIADIALTEPLRKVNDVADSIEFPSDTEGKALITRNIYSIIGLSNNVGSTTTSIPNKVRWIIPISQKGVAPTGNTSFSNILSTRYHSVTIDDTWCNKDGCVMRNYGIGLYDEIYCTSEDKSALIAANANTEFIYELATPTTELVDAPQIQEADSYSMVISQGGKAVSWSSFITE